MKAVNGVKYILWSHSFDRITGHERFDSVGKEDHFFVFSCDSEKWTKEVYVLQIIVSGCLLLLAALVNAWAFPVKDLSFVLIVILLLTFVFYYFLSRSFSGIQKSIMVSVSSIVLLFFLLNMNFYPQLLTYQGGKPLVDISKGKAETKDVYFWKNTFSSSYNFYSASLLQAYNDSIL